MFNPAFGTSSFGSQGFPSNTGTTGVFSQPQQQQSTSLFGTGGGFNQPKPTFGSSTFGSTQQNSMFGQQNRLAAPTTGIFNVQQTAAVSPFAGNTIGQNLQSGGTPIPFQPINDQDTMVKNGQPQTISTRHQCISCMKEYENKSLEELRLEDYQLNRKGQQQPQQQGSVFGTGPAQTSNVFPSLASSTSSTLFGQTSAFGNTTSGGLFSSMNQNKTQGGFFTTPASSAPSFGSSAPAFSFNNPTTQAGTVFGASNTTTGIGSGPGFFGQSSQPSTSTLFGQKPLTASTASGFGGFGSSFTNTTTTNKTISFGGSFGTTAPLSSSNTFGTGTGSLFGSNQNTQQQNKFTFPTFGQTQTSQPLFGSSTNTGTTFSFNTTTSAPAVNFGAGTSSFSTPLGGSTFGSSSFNFGGNQGFGSPFLNTSSALGNTSSTNSTFFSQPVMQQTPSSNLPMGFATTPYKDSPLFYNLVANRNLDDMIKPTSPMAQKALKEASKHRTNPASISFSGTPGKSFALSPKSNSFSKALFGGYGEDEKGISVDILSPKTSVKKLNLKSLSAANHVQPSSLSSVRILGTNSFNGDVSLDDSRFDSHKPSANSSTTELNKKAFGDSELNTGNEREPPYPMSRFHDNTLNNSKEKSTCRVTLNRGGYFIEPPIEVLNTMVDENGNCRVKALVIGRHNFGKIKFLDTVNVAGINIDDIVHFRHKEVVVYPDDNLKPPLGEGLNCPAIVTLERVWPIDPVSKDPIKSPNRLHTMKYEDVLHRSCNRLGAEFISYTPETGEWVFKVPHFSKYTCEPEEAEQASSVGEAAKISQKLDNSIATSKVSAESGEVLNTSQRNDRPSLSSVAMTKYGPPPAIDSRVIPLLVEETEYNPLTPSESNASEVDWNVTSQDDVLYESVLGDKNETSNVQMMKSVLLHEDLLTDLGEQPPSKKSKPVKRHTDLMIMNKVDKTTIDNRKSSTALMRQSVLFQESQEEHPLYLNSLALNRREEKNLKHLGDDLFAELKATRCKVRPTPRVNFCRMGRYITIDNQVRINPGVVVINNIDSYTQKISSEKCHYIKFLEAQMNVQLHGDGPLVEENIKCLSKLLSTYKTSTETFKQECMLWELCKILWPKESSNENHCDDIGIALKQREDFANWLREYWCELFGDLISHPEKGAFDFKSILELVKIGKRREACTAAVKARNYTLALCLAQAPMAVALSSNCTQQLKTWREQDATYFINKHLVKLYQICAGQNDLDDVNLGYMTTSQWLLHFALHVWYTCPPHLTLDKAVMSFQCLLKEHFQNQCSSDRETQDVVFPNREFSSIPNLCIHLLKLYSFPGYPLRFVLDPVTGTRDSLDYKLSWLLVCNLKRMGYIPEPALLESVSAAYIDQLEQIGLYHWAFYVDFTCFSRNAVNDAFSTRMQERNDSSEFQDLIHKIKSVMIAKQVIAE